MRFSFYKQINKIVPLLLIFISSITEGQVGVVKVLTIPDIGNKDNFAQKQVHFKPGYSYAPGTNTKMHAYVDASLPANTNYTSSLPSSDLDDKQIDESLSVGAINGAHSVSALGGATYAIPINIPVGTAGMQPNISIVYNSQSGSGLLGWGWNIAGLSSITRVGKTIYHDSERGGVELTTNDELALDGNRMLDAGFGEGMYGLERDMLYEITGMTTNNTGGGKPDWFRVRTHDGLTMEFGNSSSSRFMSDNPDSPGVLAWNINRIEDRNGNYMTFEYNNGDRQPRIEKISYTGNTNAGLAPYNEINFYYNYKEKPNEMFVAGASIKDKMILRSIQTNSNNCLYRKYDFSYAKSPLNTHLKEVKETGVNGEELNTTMFQYADENTAELKPNEIDRTGLPLSGQQGIDMCIIQVILMETV